MQSWNKYFPDKEEKPESEPAVAYSPESQVYDMKMLGVLDKAKDLPKYYPPQENNFDTSLSGYYQSVEKALTSDMDQANFTWTLGLNKPQLDEWASLDPNFKQQIIDYAHTRKATIELENTLYDSSERKVQGEIAKLIAGTTLTGFGMVPDQEQVRKDKERLTYLQNEDNFRKEAQSIFDKELENYNLENYNMFSQSAENLDVTKLAEFKEQELGYAKNILPIAAEIGDVILSAIGPDKKFSDVKDTFKNLPNTYGEAENVVQALTTSVGASGLAAVYMTFGAVSRTLSAGVNAIAPGLLSGWVDNLEEKEVRDYKLAAGDSSSEAYQRLSLYSWEEVKQNAPELAQTYLEFADNDEFRAASMYMAAHMNAQPEVASFVNDYVDTLNQQQLDNIQRILDSKDSIGELLVSGFGAYSKYAVGTLTTGATLLAFDEDAKELALNSDWAGIKKEIKKADYRPSFVLGIENTAAGNAMDLTLSILGDPITWLLTPAVTSSTSKVLGQFATKSRVNAFVNQTWVGKQITKEMFEVGVKFEKGEIGIRQYNALFNGFDIETQFKLRSLIKEAAKNGDKAPDSMFKAVITEAMLAGQEPLKAYNTLGSLVMGRTLRNVTTSLFGKSMKLPKKIDKFKQFNTAYSNLKQLSTTSPSFLQDASDLVSRIIGATVDNFDEQLKIYDDWFEKVYTDFSDVAAKGTATNLDEINKLQKQLTVTSDYVAYLEGLSGYKVRNVVRGNDVSATKTSINRVESIEEAQAITSQQKTIQSVITKLDERISNVTKELARAKKVQKELQGRAKELSKSESDTLAAQAKIINQKSEQLGKLKNQKKAQQSKIDELEKEIPAGSEIIESETVLFEGVFNAKTLNTKLKALQAQVKTIKASAAKTVKQFEGDITSAEKYLAKVRKELTELEVKVKSNAKIGNVPEELQTALVKKEKQFESAVEKLEKAENALKQNGNAIESQQLIAKYEDEIASIKEIQKRKTTPVETTPEGEQFLRLDPDLSTTGIQEIFNPQTAKLFRDMLDEGASLADDTLSKSYEKLLKRVEKIDDKTAELYAGLMTSKKNVTRELLKTIRKEHKLANRIAQMQIRKLQSLQKASPQNAIMNMVHDLYTDLAVSAGWASNPKWQATFVARNAKGRYVKATQAQINGGKAIEIPAVVELVGKNKYKVNWDVLRFHLRYDSDITDVGEALLKSGRIGTKTIAQKGEIVGGKLKYGKRTYLGDQFDDIKEFSDFHDVLDTASRILKSQNQVVTAQLPVSPIEFVLANQAANGGKVSKFFRAAEANEIYRKAQWINNLWIIDKIAKPSTAVVSNADELMFFNSFGNWKNYFKQSYQSKIDNVTLRRFNRAVEKGKVASGDISPELLKKYEGYVAKQMENIQKLPALLQQRGMWAESKFNDAYTILSTGDKGYYDYMISYVNGLLNDYGFQLYSTGNKQAFKNWFATADANYIRGNSILETLGNNNQHFYSYTNMTADTAMEMYEGLKQLYTINLKGSAADEVWEALKVAARERGAGINKDALPKVSTMTKIQVPGIKGRTGSKPGKLLFGKDQPMLETLFADPARFRTGLISSSAQQKTEAQLISLFESQGKKIISRSELDKVKAQASAVDPIYQSDMYGASYFDYDLFRQGYVTEDYIKAMANRAAVKDVDKYMLNYHLTSPLGRTARQIFPFGKPWLDFTKRYLGDLSKRAQVRGLYASEESNVFTRAMYNMASASPNLRRGAYISRVANADLSTEDVDFEPFVFLPNGDNFFWVSVPGFGYLPALGLGALMETLDNEEFNKIAETIFPYTVFNPDEYKWKTDPAGTLYQYTAGGGMVNYLTNKVYPTVSGSLYNAYTGNESRPFKDSIGNSAIQKDQRSTFYQDLDLVVAQMGNIDTGADALDVIISHAANAELESLLKEFGEGAVRYSIPARVNIGANYLDTAEDWIDYFRGVGLLEDVLSADVLEALEKNPNADDPKAQAIQELRNYWYTKSPDAEKILLGLQDPRVYILTQAGYEVTREGVQELSKAEGGKYTVGQVFRPYLASDPDTMERYEEYVRKGWISPRSGEDILGYTLYKSQDARLQAVKLIKEEAANLLNEGRISQLPGTDEVFEPFRDRYVEEYTQYWSSSAQKEYNLVSTDLTISSDTSDDFLKGYFVLADFSEPTQEIIKIMGFDTLFKNGQVQGNVLNNALIDEKMQVITNKSYQFTAPYAEIYTGNPNVSFYKWRQNQNAWINGGGMDEYDMIDKSRYQGILDQLDILYAMSNDEDFGPQHPKFLELREDTARAFMDFAYEFGSYYNPNDTNLQSWNNQWKDNIETWAGPLEWQAPLPPTGKEGDIPDVASFDTKGPDGNMIDFEFNVYNSQLPSSARPLNVSPLDVVDGDTITIDKYRPVPLRLRVIGIMANEINHPNEEIASEALRQMIFLEELVDISNDRLYYVPDKRFGNDQGKDSYNRELGWLFVEGGLDGNMPAGTGQYIYFEEHFTPTDRYYRRGSELGPFSDIIAPDYNEWDPQTERYILNED